MMIRPPSGWAIVTVIFSLAIAGGQTYLLAIGKPLL